MRILIVDDEELIRNVIKEYSLMEGYKVIEAENGLKALELVKMNDFDVIIMDIMMPKMDGYQAIKEIKKLKNIPCIILSARGEEVDKLYGFDLGIDDYLTKPFSPKELVSRIKAVTRRSTSQSEIYKVGKLSLDDTAHEALINKMKLKLTPKEYDLLKYFMQNKNVALSREQLLSTIWGYDFYGDDRTIDTHIKTLRKELREYGDMIVTIRGMGYKFEVKDKQE